MVTEAVVSKQRRIYQTLRNLVNLPKVSIDSACKDDSIDNIWIHHEQQYVPDFRFQWDSVNERYRVYILIANTIDCTKQHVGYCICTVGSGLVAMGFGALYSFLHKNRANNKEAAS